jgi:hypothetical protein
MTDEGILEMVEDYFKVGGIRDEGSCSEYYGTTKDFIHFSKQIRRDTLFEVISILQNVPNPEANRAAINRIDIELD